MKNAGRSILVTGGAGFIGRSLVEQLVDAGYEVVSLDDYRIGDRALASPRLDGHVRWIEGDTQDFSALHAAMTSVDAVIHLAAPSSFLMYEEDPTGGASVTTQGFLNVLEAMRKHGVCKLVYASTSAVYEGNDVPYVEGMTLSPPDLKALSKKWNEEAAQQYSERYGITAIGLRPFSVYGHGEFTKRGYANVVSLFTWALLEGHTPVVWGDGSQTRDFIYVDDAARAFKLALESELPTLEINVGTGIETSFNEVLLTIGKEIGTSVAPRYVDVPIAIYARRLLADTTRATRLLNFRPSVFVSEGVHRVVKSARSGLADHPTLGKEQMYYESLPGESQDVSI